LAKLDRIEHSFKQNKEVPTELYDIIDEQRTRLLSTRASLGDYVTPSQLS
jgi:phosphoenolpyruvate carboxykinase (GTP)